VFSPLYIGVLFGILFVKNIEWQDWEETLWYVVLVISAVLVAYAILFNCKRADHYPPTDWRPCCPVPSYYVDAALEEP